MGAILYGHTLDYSYQYDDFCSIVDNTRIRMERVTWQNLKQAWNAHPFPVEYGRPLLYLSLAGNYRLGGYNVTGFHIFNIAVHILTFCA